MLNGRKVMSPIDLANKYVNEVGTDHQELDFIYFLDGNEEAKKATIEDENEFINNQGEVSHDL